MEESSSNDALTLEEKENLNKHFHNDISKDEILKEEVITEDNEENCIKNDDDKLVSNGENLDDHIYTKENLKIPSEFLHRENTIEIQSDDPQFRELSQKIEAARGMTREAIQLSHEIFIYSENINNKQQWFENVVGPLINAIDLFGSSIKYFQEFLQLEDKYEIDTKDLDSHMEVTKDDTETNSIKEEIIEDLSQNKIGSQIKKERNIKNKIKKEFNNIDNGENEFYCDLCEKAFTTRLKLTAHKKTHSEAKPFYCEICGKSFSLLSYLAKHEKTHKIKQKYSCDICPEIFTKIAKLKVHQKIHFKVKKCPECGKEFNTPSKLELHLKVHTGEKPFSCEMCGKAFRANFMLKKHISNKHSGTEREKPFPCKECDKYFATTTQLALHLRVHTGEKPFVCRFCGKRFKLQTNVTTHERIHTGEKPYTCDVCGKKFGHVTPFNYHKRRHTGVRPFSCEVCGKGFFQKCDLLIHTRIHTGEKPYSCEACNKSFYSTSELAKHNKTASHLNMVKTASDIEDS